MSYLKQNWTQLFDQKLTRTTVKKTSRDDTKYGSRFDEFLLQNLSAMWILISETPSVQNRVEASFSDKDFVLVSVTEDCDPDSLTENLEDEADEPVWSG